MRVYEKHPRMTVFTEAVGCIAFSAFIASTAGEFHFLIPHEYLPFVALLLAVAWAGLSFIFVGADIPLLNLIGSIGCGIGFFVGEVSQLASNFPQEYSSSGTLLATLTGVFLVLLAKWPSSPTRPSDLGGGITLKK